MSTHSSSEVHEDSCELSHSVLSTTVIAALDSVICTCFFFALLVLFLFRWCHGTLSNGTLLGRRLGVSISFVLRLVFLCVISCVRVDTIPLPQARSYSQFREIGDIYQLQRLFPLCKFQKRLCENVSGNRLSGVFFQTKLPSLEKFV